MKRSNRRLKNPFRFRLTRLILFTILAASCLTALIYSVYGFAPGSGLRAGEPSPRDFITPVSTPIIDELLTEKKRQEARAQINNIYKSDPQLQRLVLSAITSANLPADVQDLLVAAYENSQGVNDEQVDVLIEEAVAETPTDRQREVRLLLERKLISTAVLDETTTNAAKAAAAAGVEPITQMLEAGQVIVEKGTPLTAEHLDILAKLGLYNAADDELSQRFRILLSSAALALLLSVPLAFLVGRFNSKQVLFLLSVTLICLAAQRFAMLFNPAFLFLSTVTLLVSSILSPSIAILWAVWLAVAMGLLAQAAPLALLIATLTGGISSALLTHLFKSRPSLLIAGLGGGLIAALSYYSLLALFGGASTLNALISTSLLIAGGAVAGIVALGILPLAESSFDFLTEFRLNELSNPNSPLLQRLLLEAPGTYQHSLMISNLVAQAVANIGGDALLARVGSLYHDVGKLKRPHFFVENQFSHENPHDNTSPHLSYLIITSHVRDGVEMLKDYKLPSALQPFAAEHHGTTVLTYFYKQALEGNDKLDEFNFRYPGPKPQSKETAVLMLADAVESASRTLKDPSPSNIRSMIDQLFELRLQDGQLSESPLNFHDIEVIASTFERMLNAILHRRIRYPSNEEIEKLERGRDNRRDKQLAGS
ncbi:MAG: HDIG domain-containing protein [Trueperaceae bacterium]|nr:HDIG domain-containing protein [Trueperaceae bacterium]